MKCSSCGAEIESGSYFCTSCGCSVENSSSEGVSLVKREEPQNPYQQQSYNQNPYQQQQYQQQQYQQNPYQQQNQQSYNGNNDNIPLEYKPIGAWGYIGYNLLFAIPLVGLIMMFIYGFSGTGNVNVKNYARSFLLMYLISTILTILWIVFIVGIFGMSMSEYM